MTAKFADCILAENVTNYLPHFNPTSNRMRIEVTAYSSWLKATQFTCIIVKCIII